MRHKAKGFTLIEALAAATLAGVGITACMSALGAVAHEQALCKEKDVVQRLARQKYDELISTNQQALASQSGDFTDRNMPDYTWNLDVENSQVSNLDTVTVTVQKQNPGSKDPVGTIEGMVYVSPNTATGTTGAAGG
jgi:type II secretory pathway pseudopilin PulG